jgi:hypothetical protein
MSSTKTQKNARSLWTVGMLAVVAIATVLILSMVSGH